MENNELTVLVMRAVELKRHLEELKTKMLGPLEEELKGIQRKLLEGMEKTNVFKIELDEGSGQATRVVRQGARKLDEEHLKKDLGKQNLDEYFSRGEPTTFIQITL